MSETRLSNPRKRKRTGHHQLPSPPLSKRQKIAEHHSVGYIDTPAFWDSLSKVWLSKYALREFDRRNNLSLASGCSRHRPITRAFAKQRNVRRNITATDHLSHSATHHSQDLEKFARRGGPDLSNLIGYPEPSCFPDHTMSSSRSNSHRRGGSSSGSKTKSTTNTTRTRSDKSKSIKRSNPSDPNFVQKLNDDNIYQYGYEHPDGSYPPLPDDWEEVNQTLARYRASLSPSAFSMGPYQTFVRKDAKADGEDEVKDSVLPAMLAAMGATDGAKKNVWFNNLEPIADGISQAKPDYYYGAHPKQLDKRVRNNERLNKHIVPSTTAHLPIVPTFFIEAKGPQGSTAEALRQACHDGAVGARAMHSLRSYGEDQPVYDNKTYAISSTYYAGTLKMYGHSVAQPNGPGTQPEYYMNQIKTYGMTSDRETFIQGATAFKNALDMTKEHRDAAIARANEIVARARGGTR